MPPGPGRQGGSRTGAICCVDLVEIVLARAGSGAAGGAARPASSVIAAAGRALASC